MKGGQGPEPSGTTPGGSRHYRGTPIRTFRLTDETWRVVQDDATRRGMTAGDVVREALTRRLDVQALSELLDREGDFYDVDLMPLLPKILACVRVAE